MGIWQLIWIIVLIVGIASFAYISLKVTIRDFQKFEACSRKLRNKNPCF
jgi:hypothetical protein